MESPPARLGAERTATPGDHLLARAQRGDRSAQAALLNDLQDVLFRYCVSMLGNPEAARDATQETALRFLQRLPTYRGDSELRTWALGIALNVCRESRRARPEASLSEDHDGAGGEEPPEDLAVAGEEKKLVRSLVEALSQRQREAIVLRFFEGLSFEAAAAAMGCATGTVKATVAQALRVLRKRWREKP